MKALALVVVSVLISLASEARTFQCDGTAPGSSPGSNGAARVSARLLVSENEGADQDGEIVLKVSGGAMDGEFQGRCWTPDPPHSTAERWPSLQCAIDAGENSGFTFFFFSDDQASERMSGVSGPLVTSLRITSGSGTAYQLGRVLGGSFELGSCRSVSR